MLSVALALLLAPSGLEARLLQKQDRHMAMEALLENAHTAFVEMGYERRSENILELYRHKAETFSNKSASLAEQFNQACSQDLVGEVHRFAELRSKSEALTAMDDLEKSLNGQNACRARVEAQLEAMDMSVEANRVEGKKLMLEHMQKYAKFTERMARKSVESLVEGEIKRIKRFPDSPTYKEFAKCVEDGKKANIKSASDAGKFEFACQAERMKSKVTNAPCDVLAEQMKRHLKAQPQYGNSLDGICALLVDVVIPQDNEPPCMQFMEEITTDFAATNGGKMVAFPGITQKPNFDASFKSTCQLMSKTSTKGKDCGQMLTKIKGVTATKTTKAERYIADVCHALGLGLKRPSHHSKFIPRDTKRGITHHAFIQAAIQYGTVSEGDPTFDSDDEERLSKGKAESSSKVDHGSFSGKKDTKKKTNVPNTCNEPEASNSNIKSVACDHVAHTWGFGVSVSNGVGVGAQYDYGFGEKSRNGDTITAAKGHFLSVCVSPADPGFSVSASVSHGSFLEYGNIAGYSVTAGASGGFIITVGAGIVGCCQDWWSSCSLCGAFSEIGIGFGFSFDYAACWAYEVKTCEFNFNKDDEACEGCFPADATVQTPDGVISMDSLKVGDEVLTTDDNGNLVYEEVYFFGHADPNDVAAFVKLDFDNHASIEATKKHFVPVCPQKTECEYEEREYKYAKDVVEGEYMWIVDGAIELAKVTKASLNVKKGKYNPYTIGGNIVVNGVLSSAHSEFVLDDYMPASLVKYLPAIYQAMFAPGRLLYAIGGSHAADALGVNSPQTGEAAGSGPEFLFVAIMAQLVAVVMLGNFVKAKVLGAQLCAAVTK